MGGEGGWVFGWEHEDGWGEFEDGVWGEDGEEGSGVRVVKPERKERAVWVRVERTFYIVMLAWLSWRYPWDRQEYI